MCPLRVQRLSAHANEPPVARVKYSILLLVEDSNLHRALKYYSVTTHSKNGEKRTMTAEVMSDLIVKINGTLSQPPLKL